MHRSRVDSSAIVHRLDASYYAPHHLARVERLNAMGVIRLPIGDVSELVTDGTHKTPNYQANGIPFLSATHIFEGSIWFRNYNSVSVVEFQQLRRWNCAPKADDVLIAKSGSIGNSAVVGASAGEFAVFESVAIVRCARFDSYYLSTFLNSRVGQEEIRRQTKGSVIQHLHLEDLRTVEVPELRAQTQAYIGSKVRQADALRERGRMGRRRAVDGIRKIVPMDIDAPVSRSQRVDAATLGSRLDCNFYAPRSIRVERAMRSAVPMIALKRVVLPERSITNGVRGPSLVSSPYRLIRLQDCLDWTIDYSKSLTISHDQFQDNRRCRLRVGDVVVAIGGYVGNAAVVREDIPAVIGQHSAVLAVNPNGPILPNYLTAYLNSDIAAAHFARYVSGTVQAGINLEDLRDIEVPLPEKSLQREISDAADLFIRASASARALVTAARLLVEALIEHKVTEADLIAAAAEPVADRALLARLTSAGLDALGEPLFPDLDALNALLSPEDP